MSEETRKLIWPASLAILIVLTIGITLSLVDSPHTNKMQRFDQKRVNDLQKLVRATEAYYKRNWGMLPENIYQLRNWYDHVHTESLNITDSVTGKPYGYSSLFPQDLERGEYQVCAEFALVAKKQSETDEWSHWRGLQCFPQKISEEVKKSTLRCDSESCREMAKRGWQK